MPADLSFRKLTAINLPLLHEWLRREHVHRWWQEPEDYEEFAKQYLPAIEGRDPTRMFLIELGGRPVGFIQTFLLRDYPERDELVHTGPGVVGVDLFIAEPELTGKGLGTAVLRRFTSEIVFADQLATACVGDPDVENPASIRAFEKAGFRRAGEFVEPEDGRSHLLMRLDRDSQSS